MTKRELKQLLLAMMDSARLLLNTRELALRGSAMAKEVLVAQGKSADHIEEKNYAINRMFDTIEDAERLLANDVPVDREPPSEMPPKAKVDFETFMAHYGNPAVGGSVMLYEAFVAGGLSYMECLGEYRNKRLFELLKMDEDDELFMGGNLPSGVKVMTVDAKDLPPEVRDALGKVIVEAEAREPGGNC